MFFIGVISLMEVKMVPVAIHVRAMEMTKNWRIIFRKYVDI
jgi:hypothetical protein